MRRARIKALATVPVRRKPLQTAAKDETNNSNDVKINENKDNANNANNDIPTNINNENNSINDINKNNDNVINDIPKNINNDNHIINDINKNDNTNVNNDIRENINNQNNIINANNINNDSNVTNDTIDTNGDKKLLKVIKEVDTLASVTKPTSESDESNVKEITIVSKSPKTQKTCVTKEQRIQPESVKQISPQVADSPEYSNTNLNVVESPTKTGQSRSLFMRPVPRLNNSGRIRSNSIQGSGASASESEDDSKRVTNNATNNRTRNDSICSIQSNKEVYSNTTTPTKSVTKTRTSQKRRIVISESARKLAESRREFQLKHENKTPDRTKLTMYDLIYYNPVGSPMKTSNQPVKSSTRIESTSQIDKELEEEEEEDDPSSLPVPQVKVGADGQLVVDEKSIRIEQSHEKKSRELFAKKAIVDDDNYGSGFYKRRPKGKEWPRWETLKFYKALNIVGTDFLLMQTLFPNRTRQEMKLKYKKEERLNRRLIEKALEFHQEFTPEMGENLAQFEASMRQQCAEEEMEAKNKEKKKLKRRLGSRLLIDLNFPTITNNIFVGFAARSLGVSRESDEDDVLEAEIEGIRYKDIEANNNQFLQKPKKRFKLSAKKPCEVATTISGVTIETTTTTMKENSETSNLISDSESGSDAEIYQIRPTRSGRVPKVRKLQGPDVNNLDNTDTEQHLDNTEKILLKTKKKPIIKSKNATSNDTDLTVINNQVNPDVITSAIPNISEVEPGSVVILSKESPEEGKTVLQVYMVGSTIDTINNKGDNDIALKETNSSKVITMTSNVSSDIQSVATKIENE
ncbi:hypothetical protein M0802_004823 [Mischocyttarus mexicanus]|nr:hypothetical protein M0802_004823 [Mischocyttarus mexicanus]